MNSKTFFAKKIRRFASGEFFAALLRRIGANIPAGALFAAICCLPAAASAAVPASVVAVGGIAPYSTEEFVKSVYGAPTYETKLPSGELYFAYGSSTSIYFSTEKRLNEVITGKGDGSDDIYIVRRIDTKKGSGFATPAGIGIDDGEEKIVAAYGKPDVKVIPGEDFDLRLMYVGEAKEENEGLCFMTFYIKDGRVAKISCYATRH